MGQKEQERELLGKLRGHLAHSKQCAPYYIFGKDEFELLLEKRPTTIEQLAGLKGFPKEGARVAKWGQAIVDLFKNPDKIEDFKVTKVDKDGDPVVESVLKSSTAF